MVILFDLLGIILFVVTDSGGKKDKGNGENTTLTTISSTEQSDRSTLEEDVMVIEWTVATTFVLSATPVLTDPESIRAFNMEMVICAQSIDPSVFDDPTSSQSRALKWLIEEDKMYVNSTSVGFLQRFSLATFYYATKGDQWDMWIQCD